MQIPNHLDKITNKLFEYTENQIGSSFVKTKGKIKRMIERGEISLVVLRVIANLLEECKNSSEAEFLSKFFLSMNSVWAYNVPRVHLPVNVEGVSPGIFYLVGVIAGDGCLSKGDKSVIISEGTPNVDELYHSYDYLQFIKNLIGKEFDYPILRISIKKQERNFYNLRFGNKIIHRYLSYFFDLPVGMKYSRLTKPRILELFPLEMRNKLESLYWRGYADTDGYVDKKKAKTSISGKNEKFMIQLMKFLQDRGLNPTIYTARTAYVVNIHFYDIKKYANLIGSSHPRKQRNLIRMMKKPRNKRLCYGLLGENLTPEGYFDFSRIEIGNPNDLKVCCVGHIVKQMRKKLGISKRRLGLELGYSDGAVGLWECGKRPIPFFVFSKIVSRCGLDVYRLLKNTELRWKVCNSYNEVKLPLKPDSELCEFIKYISPLFSPRLYAKKTYIVRGFGNYILKPREFSELRKRVGNYFGLKINYNKRNYYIYNRTLRKFLMTFYDFRVPWEVIDNDMGNAFLHNWSLLGA